MSLGVAIGVGDVSPLVLLLETAGSGGLWIGRLLDSMTAAQEGGLDESVLLRTVEASVIAGFEPTKRAARLWLWIICGVW